MNACSFYEIAKNVENTAGKQGKKLVSNFLMFVI